MPLPQFHPAVQAWFAHVFPGGATPAQLEAWPAIASGGHALIAAPTGSGKTLAAFLAAIDSLARDGAAGARVGGCLRWAGWGIGAETPPKRLFRMRDGGSASRPEGLPSVHRTLRAC